MPFEDHTNVTLDKEFGYTVFARLAILLQAISTDGARPKIGDGLSKTVISGSPLSQISGPYSSALVGVFDVVSAAVTTTDLVKVSTLTPRQGHLYTSWYKARRV